MSDHVPTSAAGAARNPGPAAAPVDHSRAGALIHAFAAVAALALVGMLTDTWQLVFLTVPLFAVVMMLQGAMKVDGGWDRASTIAILGYCVGLAVMVVWSIVTAGGDTMFWGLPVSMGVIVYLIWPYTAAVSGLLYAYVFDRTLVEEVVAQPA